MSSVKSPAFLTEVAEVRSFMKLSGEKQQLRVAEAGTLWGSQDRLTAEGNRGKRVRGALPDWDLHFHGMFQKGAGKPVSVYI